MKFISKEEFLQQPKEVQDKIKELWNPEQWDMFTYRNRKGNPYMMWKCEDGMTISTMSDVWIDLDDNNIIPLLTMDKMIEMIERVTEFHLEIMIDVRSREFNINLYENCHYFDPIRTFYGCKSKDRLHTLWEVLTDIIKENL